MSFAPKTVVAALLTASLAAHAGPPKKDEKPVRALGQLAKEPKLDGMVKDFAGATDLKGPKELEAKAGWRKDTLYIYARVLDPDVNANDTLDLNIHFPTAGTTAKGAVYRVGVDGIRAADADVSAPEWARKLVRSNIGRDDKGVTYEIAVPARALPRFPAFGQLTFNACFDWTKTGKDGATVKTVSTCKGGEMNGGPAKLPEDLRKLVKGTPPNEVEGIEPRADGWVGYAILHYPLWVVSEEKLSAENIGNLIAGDNSLDPISMALPIPRALTLGDNRPVLSVLTGKNPYSNNACNPENELRMALYVVQGKVGTRVLEWPVATCALGRAKSVDLNVDGNLSIAYSNGSQAQFKWSGDHFERVELGSR
jgi:hypothetical protein